VTNILKMGAAKTPVRDALRVHTRAIHEAMHQAPPFARIARGSMDRAGYGEVLRLLHSYHRAMAGACARAAAALGAPELAAAHAVRIAALEDDMHALDCVALAGETRTPQNDAFSVGCLYTAQGSTLGGKVIYRQLDALLPDDEGRRFFKGTPEDVSLWRGFCVQLEAYGATAPLVEIQDGAAYAFDQFARRLAGERAAPAKA
jgi:heme oxygenase